LEVSPVLKCGVMHLQGPGSLRNLDVVLRRNPRSATAALATACTCLSVGDCGQGNVSRTSEVARTEFPKFVLPEFGIW
ncbi:MAG: hypothetical protein L0Y70_04015, partial [Gemmataceae bacterium]|nr:hypothetical protein [Gemmataceae bacterium]